MDHTNGTIRRFPSLARHAAAFLPEAGERRQWGSRKRKCFDVFTSIKWALGGMATTVKNLLEILVASLATAIWVGGALLVLSLTR
jgi:hypothetical protein